jgi:hypothetical protein
VVSSVMWEHIQHKGDICKIFARPPLTY